MTDMTGWYVVVRHGGVPPREWDSLGSVMFDDLDAAREFAARLDDATVYRLEAVS